MAYGWQQNEQSEGPQNAEKIPKGSGIPVRISKVLRGSKKGEFTSSGGDPQIMLIFQDHEAREASLMLTLSHKAGFVLAKILGACDPPKNLARMEADGIEPKDFADLDFANANLLNSKLCIDLGYDKDGYALVSPVKPAGTANEPPPDDAPPVEPPPADEPAGMTKDQAWQMVLDQWAEAVKLGGEPKKTERNEAWAKAIKECGKASAELTPIEWSSVANKACCIPF